MEKRSTRGIIQSALDVKNWATKMPTASAVRPACCPACDAVSEPIGGSIVLHGHGLRVRQLRGPGAPGQEPSLVLVTVRRYECQRCGAVTTVAPAEVLTRRLYSAAAIAWALALYGISRLSSAAVRTAVSPWRVVGHGSVARWRTLVRWCTAVAARRLFARLPPLTGATTRELACHAAAAISAYAIPTTEPPPLPVLAFHGAVRAT